METGHSRTEDKGQCIELPSGFEGKSMLVVYVSIIWLIGILLGTYVVAKYG